VNLVAVFIAQKHSIEMQIFISLQGPSMSLRFLIAFIDLALQSPCWLELLQYRQ